mmetsp:Transcript_2460/g.6065  ORF Transcript_2460/g.6065 Transcript_2460/m.6065 type:complete len:133 (-) Transcript_2460:1018-1416(-)
MHPSRLDRIFDEGFSSGDLPLLGSGDTPRFDCRSGESPRFDPGSGELELRREWGEPGGDLAGGDFDGDFPRPVLCVVCALPGCGESLTLVVEPFGAVAARTRGSKGFTTAKRVLMPIDDLRTLGSGTASADS